MNQISIKNINYDEIIQIFESFEYNKYDPYQLLPNYDKYKDNNIYIYIFYYLDNYNIYKQYIKLDNNLKKYLITIIIKYIKKHIKYESDQLQNNKEYVKFFTDLINYNYNDEIDINVFKERINYKFNNKLLNFIWNTWMNFNLILLDIYYILRNLKTSYSKNGNKYKSLLSIGYFGAVHTGLINNFFLKSLYESVYVDDSYLQNYNAIRCIKFNTNINLDEIINDMYKEYNNNEDILSEYNNKINHK